MGFFQHKTKAGSSPQGKPRVYFCCHPDDFSQYFAPVSDEILATQNCAIWYSDSDVGYNDDVFAHLKQMQLFVIPITGKLLTTENAAINIAFPFAIANHIPVLPLMQEPGLEALFNQKCGDLQFLDKHNADVTAISYEEKLKAFLSSVLIGDELAEKIRAAFDAYVFLSYRKKDRKYAQELMRLIHQNEFCRDIATWYDEFLTPGENFNDSIRQAIEKSGLFVMAVTPNLVNEPNYIMSTEYPLAKQEKKPILPVELVSTDREKLSESYADIPEPTATSALSDALLDAIQRMAIKENDASAEHNFFIGLAYLNGIDVEIDLHRALTLITSAAEDGLVEAADKLYNMYLNGIGVERNFTEATVWFRKKIDLLKKNAQKANDPEAYAELISELVFLGQHYTKVMLSHEDARNVYSELNAICEVAYKKFNTPLFKSKLGLSYVYMGQMYLDTKQYTLAESRIEKAYDLLHTTQDEQLRDMLDNLKTATVSQYMRYCVSFHEMAVLYEALAEVALKKGEAEKQETYMLRCLEMRQEAAKRIGSETLRLNVAISCLTLATFYYGKNDRSKAIAYYDQGYPLAKEIAGTTGYLYAGEVTVHLNALRAQIHLQQGEDQEAIHLYRTNVANLEVSQLTPQLAILKAEHYEKLAKLYYKAGDYQNAQAFCGKYLLTCHALYPATQYNKIFSDTKDFWVDCNIRIGDYKTALETQRKIFDSQYNFYQQENSYLSALAYAMGMLEMGDVYTRCKMPQDAEKAYAGAVTFAGFIRVGFDADERTAGIATRANRSIAELYAQEKQARKADKYYSRAIKAAQSALKQYRTEGTCKMLFLIYQEAGNWCLQDNRPKDAYKHYKEAIYMAETMPRVFNKKQDLLLLLSVYRHAASTQCKHSQELLQKAEALQNRLDKA